ncbi:MAG TPA: guanylate kinase [Verrucomicrobiae bacterium]|nr:guanylate kinase [Verrucomicrobiae bacterium]
MASVSKTGLLLIISAPSGGGKTTLCRHLLSANPNTIRAITCTTREPRAGEKDGVDYYFLEAGDFLKRVQAGNFLEHATVYGNSYGTLKSEVLSKLRQGRDVLLNIDVQGAASIQAKTADDEELKLALVTLFLAPPSMAVLEERLRGRNQDSAATIQKRLSVARHEIGQWRHFDYLIVSSTIPDDLAKAQGIITAEKLRQFRAKLPDYTEAK